MSWLSELRERRATRVLTNAADAAVDMLYPLVVVARGVGRLTDSIRSWWARTPKDRRTPTLFLGGACSLVVALTPYGPWLTLAAVACLAAWRGRDQAVEKQPPGPTDEQLDKLQALYDALVPCFRVEEDAHPQPLYSAGGSWERALTTHQFGDGGSVDYLELNYPPYFPDTDPGARARVQLVLGTKIGRGREYHFQWDEESNRLRVAALGALPTSVYAQRFVTAPTETVLGFTDPEFVARTLPVQEDGQARDVPPVLWRNGPRSAEPHMLAAGQPGSGTSTLLRSVAVQALAHGEVLLIDGANTGQFSFLAGRERVLAVETSPAGVLAALEWVEHETERRLRAAQQQGVGVVAPPTPLWIVADRLALLTYLCRKEGLANPQQLLEVPLRYGRSAHVTVAVAEHLDSVEGGLDNAVYTHTRTRVLLGETNSQHIAGFLGQAPDVSPPRSAPPGQGYVRLGDGPVIRLQVPCTPDPCDETVPEEQRLAVAALLPGLDVVSNDRPPAASTG